MIYYACITVCSMAQWQQTVGPPTSAECYHTAPPWNGVQSKPTKPAATANEISWVKCLFVRNLKTEIMGIEVPKCLNTNTVQIIVKSNVINNPIYSDHLTSR